MTYSQQSNKHQGQGRQGGAPQNQAAAETYPIPRQSADAWRAWKGQSPQNPRLVFEQFSPLWGKNEQTGKGQKTKKQIGLENVITAAGKIDEKLMSSFNQRWEQVVAARNAIEFKMKTDWRMVVGLGRKGPLEAGFTFNAYGFPVIPGSSLKGITHAFALQQLYELVKAYQKSIKKLEEILDLEDEKPGDPPDKKTFQKSWRTELKGASVEAYDLAVEIRTVFGNQSCAGLGVFFEAIPTSKPKLELDIMNPHFNDYYQKTGMPKDSDNPVPIYFITVAPGTEFRFAIGWRRQPAAADLALQEKAKDWLIEGLKTLGAGAKTSAGYGYFK